MPLEVIREPCLLFSSLFFTPYPFIWAKLSSFEHVVLSRGENINIWDWKTEKQQPGAERERERERAREWEWVNGGSANGSINYLWPLLPPIVGRLTCCKWIPFLLWSLLISNLHCDHIRLKNDIVKKMNVLITSSLISPSPLLLFSSSESSNSV